MWLNPHVCISKWWSKVDFCLYSDLIISPLEKGWIPPYACVWGKSKKRWQERWANSCREHFVWELEVCVCMHTFIRLQIDRLQMCGMHVGLVFTVQVWLARIDRASVCMCLWANFTCIWLLSEEADWWWGMERIRNTLGWEWGVSRRVALAPNTTASHIITLIPLMRTTLRATNRLDSRAHI